MTEAATPTFDRLTPKQQEAYNILVKAQPDSYTLVGYGGSAGGGKMLDLATPIPTPDGWTNIGELQVGDFVFDDSGQPTRVLAVHPIDHFPRAYRLTFDDGSTMDACADHLWRTYTAADLTALLRRTPQWRAARRAKRSSRATGNKSACFTAAITARNQALPPKSLPPPSGGIRTTQEIFDSLRLPTGRANHAIPVAAPLDLPDADLPLHPYLLGLWLGDGTSTQGSYTTADPELAKAFGVLGGFGVAKHASLYGYGILGLQVVLRSMGVLGAKHVPPAYLRGSHEQRLALLQGLMDTDGTVAKKKNGQGLPSFTTTSPDLAAGVHELICSLGWKTRINEGRARHYGRDVGAKYTLAFSATDYVFRLPRKRDIQTLAARRTTQFRYIVDCQPIPPKPMRCITVANDSGLFLAGRNFIPTHNSYIESRIAIDFALAYPGTRILIGRKALTTLKTTTMAEFFRLLPARLNAGQNDTENWVKIRNPAWPEGVESRVYFRGLEDYLKYGSEAYQIIIIDEASELDAQAHNFMLTRLRWKLPPSTVAIKEQQCRATWDVVHEQEIHGETITYPVTHLCGRICPDGVCSVHGRDFIGNGAKYLYICASNPWPGWFTDVFWKRSMDETLEQLAPGCKVHFVHALPRDNPHLPKNYVAMLRGSLATTPDLAARLIEGRFDVFTGRVYEAFDPDTHEWRAMELPKYVRVIGGLDFGGEGASAHMSAGLVMVVTQTNRLIVVDEFYARGTNIAHKQQQWMSEMEMKWGHPIGKQILWTADKTQTFGIQTIRKSFRIRPSKGGRDSVEEGVKLVARYLNRDANGIPGLFYLPSCRNFKMEMTEYRRDPETMKIIKESDHLMDALRYPIELLDQPYGDPNRLLKNRLAVVK